MRSRAWIVAAVILPVGACATNEAAAVSQPIARPKPPTADCRWGSNWLPPCPPRASDDTHASGPFATCAETWQAARLRAAELERAGKRDAARRVLGAHTRDGLTINCTSASDDDDTLSSRIELGWLLHDAALLELRDGRLAACVALTSQNLAPYPGTFESSLKELVGPEGERPAVLVALAAVGDACGSALEERWGAFRTAPCALTAGHAVDAEGDVCIVVGPTDDESCGAIELVTRADDGRVVRRTLHSALGNLAEPDWCCAPRIAFRNDERGVTIRVDASLCGGGTARGASTTIYELVDDELVFVDGIVLRFH